MPAKLKIIIAVFVIAGLSCIAYADDAEKRPKAQGWDMVSDTVAQSFDKVNALLTGNLELKMSLNKPSNGHEFTVNAIGQKVPKATAVKSAGSLHNDQPL